MKFSLEPFSFASGLRVLQRRRGLKPGRSGRLRIKAKSDGVFLETDLCSAFVPAHVAVAGACSVDLYTVERVVGSFPRGKPVAVEMRGDLLYVGRWGIKTKVHFLTRENELYRRRAGARSDD